MNEQQPAPQENNPKITLESIMAHTERLSRMMQEQRNGKKLLKVKPANEWIEEAKTKKVPRMLFSELWFEGEVCILFADTNTGKSILAVQVGVAISTGQPISGFKMEAEPQKVLYFDFELTSKQFENRYSKDYAEHFRFSDNFLRVEINTDADIPDDFAQELNDAIEAAMISTGARVLIIDNITHLKDETEKSGCALSLMKHLKALKNKYDLSILALAHTPKRSDTRPLTRNDVRGSGSLGDFCDTSFAIGRSASDKTVRYIKQIKERNVVSMFGADSVCTCRINKPHNFLQFEFMGYGKEWEHLKDSGEKERMQRNEQVMAMHSNGKSYREIAKEMGISHVMIKKIIDAG